MILPDEDEREWFKNTQTGTKIQSHGVSASVFPESHT